MLPTVCAVAIKDEPIIDHNVGKLMRDVGTANILHSSSPFPAVKLAIS